MELMYWWLTLILIALLVVCWLIARWRVKKHPKKSDKLPLAHSDRLMKLPEYQQAINKMRWLTRAGLLGMILLLLTGTLLAGRLVSINITEPETKNRDIMLCLDVSGSMTKVDGEIAKIYSEMVKGFEKERIGMVVFNSSASVVFPLTNDYDFVSKQLSLASKFFEESINQFNPNISDEEYSIASALNNTYNGRGSSIIGDGLASCINRFDRLDSQRSRSIIFATDNYLAGEPLVTLDEAASVAKSKKIRVYGLNPADYSSQYGKDKVAESFKKATLLTDGDYYKLQDKNAVSGVVKKITAQEATRFKGSPQILKVDQPQFFLMFSLVMMTAFMVIAWRSKL